MLSGPSQILLKTTITQLYVDQSELEDNVLLFFEWRLNQITGATRFPDMVADVIRFAIQRGKLLDFIDEIGRQRTDADLTPFRHEILNNTWGQREAVRMPILHGNRIMIDRHDLRNKIDRIKKGERNVLAIKGEPYSGKSYSLQLIRHLQAQHNDFTFVFCDMLDPVALNPKPITAEMLASKIALQLKMPIPELTNEGQVARWMANFTDRLVGHLERDETYWIVIDHLNSDKVLVESSANELVIRLALLANSNMPNLRLILIDFGEIEALLAALSRVPDPVEFNEVNAISVIEELPTFFTNIYEFKKTITGEAYTGDDVESSVNHVIDNADSDNEPVLGSIAELALDEVSRIKEAVTSFLNSASVESLLSPREAAHE